MYIPSHSWLNSLPIALFIAKAVAVGCNCVVDQTKEFSNTYLDRHSEPHAAAEVEMEAEEAETRYKTS